VGRINFLASWVWFCSSSSFAGIGVGHDIQYESDSPIVIQPDHAAESENGGEVSDDSDDDFETTEELEVIGDRNIDPVDGEGDNTDLEGDDEGRNEDEQTTEDSDNDTDEYDDSEDEGPAFKF
jgi:hypothetical protein